MSKIDSKVVHRVAELSRLSFSKEEVELYTGQLNSILDYVEKLNELPTEGVDPTLNPNPVTNVLREDAAAPGFDLEEALANAPESDHGCFQVPKIL